MDQVPGTFQAGGANFESTHWSVVLLCAQPGSKCDDLTAREALNQLCQTYWPPLYTFARRRGYSSADAQDLTQGFFAHLLANRTYSYADPARGRFRTFLLGAFKNFLANAYDHAQARKRGGGVEFIPLEEGFLEAENVALATVTTDAERLFEQRWAAALVRRAWTRVRTDADTDGKTSLLDKLMPFVSGGAPVPDQEDAARQLGVPAATLRTQIHRLRGRFRDALRAEVAHTVANASEIAEELRHLHRVLLAAA